MTPPRTIIRQVPAQQEGRKVATAAMLRDIEVRNSSLDALSGRGPALFEGALPVGSVEFVREAMRLAGIIEPENISYMACVRDLLLRDVRMRPAGTVLGRVFVKPVRTKAFTGFVFDTMQERESYSEHDQEQYDAFMALGAMDAVWACEPVRFLSEWRYYVHDDRVIGGARYDQDGSDDVPEPARAMVEQVIERVAASPMAPRGYAVDLGVLDSGETALVELNDGWAIGLYGSAIEPGAYLDLLWARWSQLIEQRDGWSAASARVAAAQ